MKINILVDNISSRLNYTLNFIFTEVLKTDYKIFCQLPSSEIIHINYSSQYPNSDVIRIPVSGFLTDIDAEEVECTASGSGRDFRMFTEGEAGDFDLFAMVFYCIGRYEEYFMAEKDEVGRLKTEFFTCVKNNFEDIPLIDILIIDFYKNLRSVFRELPDFQPEFSKLAGIDIDYMYCYQHKSWWRFTGSLLKAAIRFDIPSLKSILESRIAKFKDPYICHENWMQPLSDSDTALNVFVLAAMKRVGKDDNLSPHHPAFKDWLTDFYKRYQVDFQWHPSLRSHSDFNILKEEKLFLESLSLRNIFRSRQHFLLFTIPHTFRNLIKLGIREEHSMGFYDRPGYRASTAYPHQWYDLEKEEATDLRIFPFVVMDVQLLHYLNLSVEQSLKLVHDIISNQKLTGGVFSFIWHNSSFLPQAGWKGWEKVYRELVK